MGSTTRRRRLASLSRGDRARGHRGRRTGLSGRSPRPPHRGLRHALRPAAHRGHPADRRHHHRQDHGGQHRPKVGDTVTVTYTVVKPAASNPATSPCRPTS